jgi:hypothetical protein
VLEDSTVSFDLVIDCKHLYTALDPPIGWLIEALKTIPEEISTYDSSDRQDEALKSSR